MATQPFWEEADVRRAIFDQLDHHVLLLEIDSGRELRIADANGPALRAHGYSREELVGRPLSFLDPFTPPAVVAEALTEIAAGRTFARDVRHRRKDGSLLDLAVRATQVPGRQLVLSVERDISHRIRTARQLEHSHRLMDYVISHARSAIAVHDRELRYVYVSERYLKEYKVAAHDVIGKHHYDVFPDLPQKWRDVHQRALRGEVASAEEDPYQRADGTVEWTRWECRPWYESDGSIGGIIVYTEVITDRKRADEERKALERQLQQAMKMEAVGRLAGGIAHDFNNLLTAMSCNVELGILGLGRDHPVAERLRDIGSAVESAASLTRQLLAFSRKQLIQPKVLDLNGLIKNTQRLLSRLIGEDVALRVRLGDDLPPVEIDPGQFEQALVNLAVNARDAMPDGGDLVIETARVLLDADYCATHAHARPGEHVMLAVSDTGQGMSDEVKRHLFEPFFTTKTTGQGTGLGLATIFGIVKQAGGSIEVYSEVGHGTSFKIYLPCAPGLATPPEAETQGLPGGTETILLVEDDARVRSIAAHVLVRLGYDVLQAADGAQALTLAQERDGPIHLLLTDVIMPGINGRDLAKLLAEMRLQVKVLFASGYTDNIIAHHGVLDPGLRFIAKPYTPEALAKKIREVLDR